MRRIWGAAAAALFLWTGATHAQVLRWTSQGDLQTLDPHSQNELLTNSINGQVYETLVGRDKQLRHAPALATQWEALSPTAWRMKLRPGVRFHDGSPFTADDVVFSIQRAREPTSAIRVYAAPLGEVRKLDDLTVEFRLPQYNPIFLDHASFIPIMSRAWSARHDVLRPLDFRNGEEKHTALNANGTGPFMVVSRQPDAVTRFRRNPSWWGRFEGNVQEVVYTPIRSDATRVAALVAGEVDLVLDPAPQDLQRLKAMPAVKVLEGPENRVLFLGMDQGRDELLYASVKGRNPFRDLRVRQALYHAIDVEAIRTRLMNGRAQPTGSMSPSPLATAGAPDLERRLPFDPALARKLMADAGYADGFDVTLDCPNNRYVHDEEICTSVAAMWARIGVRARVNAMPRALYFPKLEKLDTSLYLYGWGGTIWDLEVMITPVLRPRGPDGIGFFNFANYQNPKVDELGAASSREPDPARRQSLVHAVLREQQQQVHTIPLHRQFIAWAMRPHVDVVLRPDNWLEWQWVRVRAPAP